MIKKILILALVVMLSLSVVASSFAPVAGDFSPKKLTIVNKSGGPAAFKLVPTSGTEGYLYDESPSGSKASPTTKVYSIIPGEYYFYTYYWKETFTYDSRSVGMLVKRTQICLLDAEGVLYYDAPIIDMTKNYKRTILPCDGPEPANLGEPNMDKFWYPNYIEATNSNWYQPLYEWMEYYIY